MKSTLATLILLAFLLSACVGQRSDSDGLAKALKSRNKNLIYVAIGVVDKHEDTRHASIKFDRPYVESQASIDAYAAMIDSYTESFLEQMNVEYRSALQIYSPIWSESYWP
jgi:PBP1b-binding outer membrane lipoprotein LpoB